MSVLVAARLDAPLAHQHISTRRICASAGFVESMSAFCGMEPTRIRPVTPELVSLFHRPSQTEDRCLGSVLVHCKQRLYSNTRPTNST